MNTQNKENKYMGYIYKITNNINNKLYIGQTIKTRPTDRFSQHKYIANHLQTEKGNSYLHRAMANYGVNNFTFEVIEQIDNTLLNERQQYWIKFYNSLAPNGYNLTQGGSGTKGYSRSQTLNEKLKRQDSNKKFYINNPQAKQKASQRTKKLWQNEEYRKKVTDSVHNFYDNHPDIFSGENNPMYGKKHTQEAKEKIQQAANKRKLKIAQLDKDTLEIIKIYDGVKDAEKALNVSHGWISKAARQDKVAYGYRWKFV